MPKVGRRGLSDALFSKTQQRVLGLFFGQPDRQFFLQELINLSGSGSGAVQREVATLVDSGLVEVTQFGAQKFYRAHRAAPIFDELRAIVMKTVGLADPLRAALRPLGKRITLAFVFGSVAKGTDRAQSDIDLLVVGDNLTLEQLFSRLASAERKLGRTISPTLYTRAEYRSRIETRNTFLQKVRSGERILLIGSEDDLDQP
jgi:predicted nucleotidyltransferase